MVDIKKSKALRQLSIDHAGDKMTGTGAPIDWGRRASRSRDASREPANAAQRERLNVAALPEPTATQSESESENGEEEDEADAGGEDEEDVDDAEFDANRPPPSLLQRWLEDGDPATGLGAANHAIATGVPVADSTVDAGHPSSASSETELEDVEGETAASAPDAEMAGAGVSVSVLTPAMEVKDEVAPAPVPESRGGRSQLRVSRIAKQLETHGSAIKQWAVSVSQSLSEGRASRSRSKEPVAVSASASRA